MSGFARRMPLLAAAAAMFGLTPAAGAVHLGPGQVVGTDSHGHEYAKTVEDRGSRGKGRGRTSTPSQAKRRRLDRRRGARRGKYARQGGRR